ncbi:SipW-dependent-type signal peptide-containing protein [Nesterenkonia alba]|uniref:SipW-dependent-type signal peptide-containing protein n=1 Tax=Nesterenkonia alba TaxID=515814 RepID=UPI00041108E5|nr:SipW-dependent-type signal peptide-containing protein [Nesterenkonia alba]
MTEEVQNKTNGRKKAAIAGGALGLGALVALGGGTLAAWNDAETAETSFETGGFGIEISTDGGETFVGGTVEGTSASIDISGIVDDVDGETWRPGDSVTTTVHIAATDDTTHDGVIANIGEEYSGIFADNEAWISYSLTPVDGEFIPADGTPVEYEFTVELADVEEVAQGGTGSAQYTFEAELATEAQSVDNTIVEDGGDAGEEG